MAGKKEFGEGAFYSFFNYVMWIFASNMYFMLCNVLLVLYIMIFSSDITHTYVLLYIVLLPMAPALTALYATVGKIIRDKDISVTKYFFKAYKNNFKQAFVLGFLECTTLLVSFIDVKYFSTVSYGKYIIPIFAILSIFIFCTGLYAFPVLSRFYLKTTDILKFAFVYSIKKINITILNLSLIVCAAFILVKVTSIAMFFIFSGTCYLIMFYDMKILNELEVRTVHTETQESV